MRRIIPIVVGLVCAGLSAAPHNAGDSKSQRNEPLTNRYGVPLSQILKDPRAKGPVVVILKDTPSGPELVLPAPVSEAAKGGRQLEFIGSLAPIALVVYVDQVESRLTPRQDWIVATVHATIETVIKQPSTESLSPKQRIEFQQDGGEMVIDQRRVRAVVPYSDPHATESRYLVFASRNPPDVIPEIMGPPGWLSAYAPTSYLISSAGRLQSLCAGPICQWPHSENGVELSEAIRRITARKTPTDAVR